MNKEEIESFINEALNLVYRNDSYLISHGAKEHNHEVAIVHRFGHYMECIIRMNHPSYDVHFDIEFNRNLDEVKRLSSGEGLRPDFIIHQRGNNGNNLLVLEFKTWWHQYQNEDIRKIKELLNPDGDYQYQFGATVLIKQERGDVKLEFIGYE